MLNEDLKMLKLRSHQPWLHDPCSYCPDLTLKLCVTLTHTGYIWLWCRWNISPNNLYWSDISLYVCVRQNRAHEHALYIQSKDAKITLNNTQQYQALTSALSGAPRPDAWSAGLSPSLTARCSLVSWHQGALQIQESRPPVLTSSLVMSALFFSPGVTESGHISFTHAFPIDIYVY